MLGAQKLVNISDLDKTEWLQYRQKGLGGSDIGVILGANKYKSELTLWLEKTTDYNPTEENEAIRQGRDLEDYVANRFCEATGKQVETINYMLQSNTYDCLLANIDRKIIGENAILECKTANSLQYHDYLQDNIPPAYIMQCYHYMNVCPKIDKVYLAVLVFGKLFKYWVIERDNEVLKILEQKSVDWWERHIINNEIPDVDGSVSTDNALKYMFDEENQDKIILDDKYNALCEQIQIIKNDIKQLEKKKKQTEQQIKMVLENHTEATTGYYKITHKEDKNGRKIFKIIELRKEQDAKYE